MNMIFKRKLPIPQDVKEMYPISEEALRIKENRDKELKAILDGKDNRLILVIGPCSADREDSVMEYISRLAEVEKDVNDILFIIPRMYTNKPRTTGEGYKGMLHQPDPLRQSDLLKGIIAIRKLHMRALNETKFSCADEMLYPTNHRYLSDALGYVAVGARSVENQEHRLTASGLDLPVGLKNPTSGDLSVVFNALKAAQNGHTFIYRGWEVETKGNPYAHIILRGYKNSRGICHENYTYNNLKEVISMYKEGNFQHPAILIDCNHNNSNKQYEKQIEIANDVLESREKDPEVREFVKGLMIESYLEDGCQHPDGTIYGKSITDPCLGWEKSKALIYQIADRLRKGGK